MAKAKSEVGELNSELDGGEEVQSNWAKFEKINDYVKGTLLSREVVASTNPVFPDQLVCKLKKADGSVWNVGVSMKKKGTVERLQNAKIGEIIAVIFTEEIEATVKGFANTKKLTVKTWGKDPNYSETDGGDEVDVPPEM